jgi:hypothetical protein
MLSLDTLQAALAERDASVPTSPLAAEESA